MHFYISHGDRVSRSASGSTFVFFGYSPLSQKILVRFFISLHHMKALINLYNFYWSAKTLDLVLWIWFGHFYLYMDPQDHKTVTRHITSSPCYSKNTKLIHLTFSDIRHICLVYALLSFTMWSKIQIRIQMDLSIFGFTSLSQKRLGRF